MNKQSPITTSPLHVSVKHESAIKQVAGRADYIDDLVEPEGTLHAYLGLSTKAHADIASMNLDAVRAAPGVVGVLTAEDIPAENDVSSVHKHDEPVFATTRVVTWGQPLFAVIGKTREAARRAAKLAKIEYRELPHVTDVDAAVAAGANIANGSPIGDTPPPLLALGASITLRKGDVRRTVKLEDFFIAYGKQDRQPGEFVEAVTIPSLPEGEQLACYKITKRKDEDISALCGAYRLKLEGGKVAAITIAYGGMAATPKRAKAVEAALLGKAWTVATVEAAIPVFAEDYQPLTDMRASAEYRLLAAQNLLRRFFLETTGEGERLTREVA